MRPRLILPRLNHAPRKRDLEGFPEMGMATFRAPNFFRDCLDRAVARQAVRPAGGKRLLRSRGNLTQSRECRPNQ